MFNYAEESRIVISIRQSHRNRFAKLLHKNNTLKSKS